MLVERGRAEVSERGTISESRRRDTSVELWTVWTGQRGRAGEAIVGWMEA